MIPYLIPQPLCMRAMDGIFHFHTPSIEYNDTDERVRAELDRILDKYANGTSDGRLLIRHASTQSEAYDLTVTADTITVSADSAAGAFYALQTMRQLLAQGTDIPCVEIHDRPQFGSRGLYHDVTRGRIPTLNTLKALADQAALYKMNTLQLYVEHSFDFAEYREINEGQEPLTAHEMREFDCYCRERFIDLIPSLSCFGHLYALLQNEHYAHLCELENYTPAEHLWAERMAHHTIDPTNPESFALITSLIDQYLPLFSSKYFNICCDETFDLGRGRNAGKDSGRLYIDFVSKLVDYLEKKGKTVMLWGDIVLKHIDLLPELSERTVLLNWSYGAHTDFSHIKCFEQAGRAQIVCPGVSGWTRLNENIPTAEQNIRELAIYGKLCGAQGLLNTNWGDYGHLCGPENVMHGIVLGAAEAWNPGAMSADDFDQAFGVLHYRNYDGAVMRALRLAADTNIFWQSYLYYRNVTMGTDYPIKNDAFAVWHTACTRAADLLHKAIADGTADSERTCALLLNIEGAQLIAQGLLSRGAPGHDWYARFTHWCGAFAAAWQRENKKDELPIVLTYFSDLTAAIIQGK